jgi:hypothetical protein
MHKPQFPGSSSDWIFFTVSPSICVSSVRNLLHVTFWRLALWGGSYIFGKFVQSWSRVFWNVACSSTFFQPTHCGCKGILLHLITLNGMFTLGRIPLDEGWASRRDLYLTTHNTHKRRIQITPVGFEPAIPASVLPQTYALDSAYWYLLA